jgi:hypothetical protein
MKNSMLSVELTIFASFVEEAASGGFGRLVQIHSDEELAEKVGLENAKSGTSRKSIGRAKRLLSNWAVLSP